MGLSDAQKAAKRMQKLGMRRAATAVKRSFVLSDLDPGLEDHLGTVDEDLILTHGGRPIMDLAEDVLGTRLAGMRHGDIV